MGVVVTAASGFDLGYVWRGQGGGAVPDHDARRDSGYYLRAAEAGEAPGRWSGRGAEALGLAPGSIVDRRPYDDVYRQKHPGTGEQLGRRPGNFDRFRDHYERLLAAEPHATAERRLELEREAAQATRKSPAYTDVTVSLSKSVSILDASIRANAQQAREAGDVARAEYWDRAHARFEGVLQDANRAGLEHLEQWAGITRTGTPGARINGEETARFERAGLVVSSWLQGTSRDGDPQLHVHNQVARMARTDADGRWRAADTMSIRAQLPAVNAIVTAHAEAGLAREFDVAWQPRNLDGYGIVNEIKGVTREEIDMFSARTAAIHETLPAIVAQWKQEHGREPSRYDLKFLQNEATMSSRRGKDPGAIDWDEYARRWDAKHGALAQVAPRVSGLGGDSAAREAHEPREPSPGARMRAMATALEAVQAKSATWTRADLMREMARAIKPEDRTALPSARAVALVHDLTDRAIAGEACAVADLSAPEVVPTPAYLRRELDGKSVYTRPGATRYATQGQLDREERLAEQAGQEGAPVLAREVARQRMGDGLRADQRTALEAALTSPRRAYMIVGPAGSGKTRVLAEAARIWDGPVIGIAPSQAARNVLARAASIPAYNTARFLGHSTSARGAYGPVPVKPGTLLLADEASMTSMTDMADIIAHSETAGAKVIIAGDHAQLSAVEQAGAMDLLASRYEYAQLAEPVRFRHEWEREASLRLRDGDKTVIDSYDQQGRIHAGAYEDMLDAARQAYVAGYGAGQDMLLMARDHATVRELSRRIRADLQHLGYVDDGREVELREGERASVGDLIVTRHNQHQLGVVNGQTWRIEEIRPHQRGETVVLRQMLDADPDTGARRFDDETITYQNTAWHADLAYALTGHSAQGRTVAQSRAVLTGSEDRDWLYVAMSRGQDANHVYAVTDSPKMADPQPAVRAAPEIAVQERMTAERAAADPEQPDPSGPERDARGLISDVLDRDNSGRAATITRESALSNADHLGVLHAIWQAETRGEIHGRYERLLRDKLPDTELSRKSTWLFRSLRAAEAAGLDADQVLDRAIGERPLDGARDVAAVLDARVREATGTLAPVPGRTFTERTPGMADPERAAYVLALAEAMDARTARLGEFTAETRPEWSRILGPVPDDPLDRLDWQERAGKVAAYREIYGLGDERDPVGAEPPASDVEQREDWWTAFEAAGRTEDIRREPDGQLLILRDQYEAETGWAPRHVGRELRQARLDADSAWIRSQRAADEARVAREEGEERLAVLHEEHARTAGALAGIYREHEAGFADAMDARQAWQQATRQHLHEAVAADSEYRRRHPDTDLGPLRNAEPPLVSDAERDELAEHDAERAAHWDPEREAEKRRNREAARGTAPETEAWPQEEPDDEWEPDREPALAAAERAPQQAGPDPEPDSEPEPGGGPAWLTGLAGQARHAQAEAGQRNVGLEAGWDDGLYEAPVLRQPEPMMTPAPSLGAEPEM